MHNAGRQVAGLSGVYGCDEKRQLTGRMGTVLATFQHASYDWDPMDLVAAGSKQMVRALPQVVPGSACFRCDVCCRFPEADSFLRPYFTDHEITQAVAHGLPSAWFPNKSGSQINLVKSSDGEGYLCPAFDAQSGRCGMYEQRPLDCRLYPLALMWDESGQDVLLGWDTKCPFMRDEPSRSVRIYAEQVEQWLRSEAIVEQLVAHPRLIGRFQDDVIVLSKLPHLTTRLMQQRTDPRLHPLTPADAPAFAAAVERAHVLDADRPAAFAFPYHYMWTSVLSYWWMELDGTWFLFAQSPDGWFMPLPPLGPGSLDQAVDQAFTLMQRWNGPSPVSRIEQVMDSQKSNMRVEGIQFRSKEGDYLYSAAALATLAGDPYKSQRALCNRAAREQAILIEPYRTSDQADCEALYRRWAAQKCQHNLDQLGTLLLEDAEPAHRLVFQEHDRIAVSGTVFRVNNEVLAYTFGYWLTPQTWCVLLEVADRSVPGLAQWVFRETCRVVRAQGAVWINAMDDVGLPGLRAAKLAYHPTTVLTTWIATRTTT
ncbi:phosphatidylglycerol lysyltransferase domain-containing protein [Nitrospira sp. CMX1]